MASAYLIVYDQLMSRSWSKGSTYAWRKLRAQILLRDNAICQLQLPGICTNTATQVHHTKGKAQTGDDPNHLLAVCRECNLKIGDPSKRQNDPTPEPRTLW